jgi:16S rRNA (guanine527-N7)-methyltransferase
MPRVNATSLRLATAEKDHLLAAAAALGIELSPSVLVRLSCFADVLDIWSRRMNLLSCGSAHELVERHFLDSLAIAPAVPELGLVVDLGSGAGFPGLPLAILRPDQQFILVESRRRRTTFLREARRTLRLSNVDVLEQRAETPAPKFVRAAAAAMTRAVWSDDSIIEIADRWLQPDGTLLWMRADPLPGEFRVSPFERQRCLRYRIGEGRPRCVEILKVSRDASVCFT